MISDTTIYYGKHSFINNGHDWNDIEWLSSQVWKYNISPFTIKEKKDWSKHDIYWSITYMIVCT